MYREFNLYDLKRASFCDYFMTIYFRAMLLATKMLSDFMTARHATTCNFACNLYSCIVQRD